MATLCNRSGHYIFALWFLFFFLLLYGRPVWNVLRAARWKYRTQKIAKKSPSEHHPTTLSGYIFATKACIDNRKKLVKQQYVLHMSPKYGELRPTSGWDLSLLWGTPGNFNGFRILAALLHGTLVVGISQTLRRWTEGATYIRQGGHHVGHWPTFLVLSSSSFLPRDAAMLARSWES